MEKQKYQAYATATQTVAKTRQIVMLYDGAIRFMKQAKEAIADNRIEDRYNTLVKANDILIGLQSCLDFENGGDIAKVLYGYYAGLIDRIFTIHRTSSAETCDEVIADLKQMRDVWDGIDRSDSPNDPSGATASQESSDSQDKKDPKDNPPQNITISA
jgi:flagellar secretion chaperone FliS